MIWYTLSSDERLHLWKKFRDDITTMSREEQLTEVAKFCSKTPMGPRTLDYYSPAEWPTPWEILYNDSFCVSSVSLLMFYTLILLPAPHNVELLLVQYGHKIHLLPIIDNQFILNFELGHVSNYADIHDNFEVLQRYTSTEIKKIK